MAPRSLRSLLLRRLLGPMLAVTVAGGMLTYVLALKFADDTYDEALLDTAHSLALEVEVDRRGTRLDLPRPALNMLEWDIADRIYFRVDSEREGLIAGHKSLQPAVLEGAEDQAFRDSTVGGQKVRSVTIAVPGSVPLVRVTVAETLHKRNRLADEVLITVVLPQLLLIGLAVYLIRSGIRRGLSPINELEQAVHERTSSDLAPLPESGVPEELRPFTEAINALLARLGKAIDSQNQFIANAAHQMRTPLAALQVQLERTVREPDLRAHGESLRQALASLERTTRLVNQLLLLARAESDNEAHTRFGLVDLRQIAFDSGAAWVPKALAQGADLGFDDPEQAVSLHGDPLLLAEVVNNLIDNALRYAGPGPRITLRVEPETVEHGPALAVEDDGPGIPAEARERIFERFYRPPGSPGGGSGLVLASVREIALLHGAKVALQQSEQGGLMVRLAFPHAE